MGYESLEWDSDFFGIPIGRVSGFDGESLKAAVEEADAGGIRCLYLLCPAADLSQLHTSLSLGFLPYDVRVELSRAMGDEQTRSEVVREARGEDEEALLSLAGDRMRDTRFWADEHFPRERVRALYEEWLRRGLSTFPLRRTLVIGEAEGFITCHFDAENGVGRIELIAVAQGREGAELSDALVEGANCAFAAGGLARATVATQGRNVAAQRLYQRNGYRTSGLDIWLHRWA